MNELDVVKRFLRDWRNSEERLYHTLRKGDQAEPHLERLIQILWETENALDEENYQIVKRLPKRKV